MKIYQSNINDNINPINTAISAISTSNKYKHQSSVELINIISNMGLEYQGASFGKPRKQENKGFQKHIMTFSNEDLRIDDHNQLTLLVTNSHDGTSSLKFDIGVFRAICANGLIAGDSFDSLKVMHKGNNFKSNVYNSISTILKNKSNIVDIITEAKNKELSLREIYDLYSKAVNFKVCGKDALKWDDQSFNPRRNEDCNNDLYTVFNRIQEVLVKGGLQYAYVDRNNENELVLKRNTTKAIKGVDNLIKTNKFCWNLMEKQLAA